MGVQPPSDGIENDPDVVEFGIAALDARISELSVSFPVESDHLQAEYGDVTVPVDASGTEITLGEALEEANRVRFDSERDLLNALHPVFEQRRTRASRSLLARLRGLVPF